MNDLFSGAAEEDHSVEKYQEVLDGLSEAQRRAVTHDDGALIVLAGPGTGKTRVITARVAHMIRERGIAADRIAAVTFTNKAAEELRIRLGELVGATVAGRVHAATFHSLGFKIVRRFADVLGLKSNFQIIDSAQRNRLIREIIRDEGLYRGSLGSGISAAAEHSHQVMESLRHTGMESREARAWLVTARDESEAIDGDERAARIAELDRFGEAVEVYGHFEQRCLDQGWVVIDDLIMMPTRLVREHDSIASILRHDYGHLVVDEFQDVNQAQIEMVRALCPPSASADVCVVGDDDQSIYGFRGADDLAFARFASVWGGATTVELTTNYRSANVIVEAGNASIARATSRFAPDKQASSHRGAVPNSGMELVKLDDDAQTGEAIVSMLLEMASEGGEDFSFSDCAVIARSNPFLEQIAQSLMLEGIPIDMREKASPMEDEGAKDVFAWARLLIDPESSMDLRRVLVRPPYRVDPVVLGSHISGYRAARSRFENCEGEEEKDPGTLIGWVMARCDGQMLERVRSMHGLAQELGQVVSEQRAAEAVMEIIKRSGVVHRDLGDARSRARRISAVSAIVKFARTRGDRFDAPGDLGSMLSYFDDLDVKDQTLGELPEEIVTAHEGGGRSIDVDRGAVSMLTAHSSKGLEFKTVIIARVGRHGYAPSGKGEEGVLPEGVVDRGDDERDSKSRVADEERRVFFVALTRAEDRAILTATIPKKATAANYALELRASLGERLVERDVHDVTDPDRAGDAVSRLSAEFKAIRGIRDAFDQAKREARRDASMAIDAHELGEIDRDELVARLGLAADRAAVVHEVLDIGRVPDWVNDDVTRGVAEKLVGVLEAGVDQKVEGALHPGLDGALSLSFSRISSYLHCPRCYLVEHVIGLQRDERVHAVVGTAVHEGLERFYIDWREADAEGGELPRVETLRELVRERFWQHWPRDRSVEPGQLEQLGAMVDMFWEKLHLDEAHIEEIEKESTLAYVCDGVTHTIRAKLDRVDLCADGGRRVVDYKTGAPRKKLVEPKKDDLQLGIYAMALLEELGDPGPGSTCEYWCLQDGSRGVIGFDSLDLKKVRRQIDKAIRGMRAGEWSRSSKCKGGDAPCTILDEPGFVFSDTVREETDES